MIKQSQEKQIHFFFSNQVEKLTNHLQKELVKNTNVFTQRLLLVPNKSLKIWLNLKLADAIGVSTGIDFNFLSNGINEILKQSGLKPTKILNGLEQTLLIQDKLKNIFEYYSTFPKSEQKIYKSIFNYLLSSDETLSTSKLIHLSKQFSKLFSQYSRYGGRVIESWKETSKQDDFQKVLWSKIFDTELYTYLYKQIMDFDFSSIQNKDMQIHLFGFSFLSQLEYSFFYSLSRICPVYIYSLSPSAYYWSDLRTKQDKKHLIKFYRDKQASAKELDKLQDYLDDNNTLLANLGKLGRKWISLIEEDDFEIIEEYFIEKKLSLEPQYQALLFQDIQVQDKKQKMTLLSALQCDMLLLRNPEKGKPIEICEHANIQIHEVPTKMREIEVLYDNLLSLIDENKGDQLFAKDILVLVSDIEKYTPYIETIFGHKESLFDFHIQDKSFLHGNIFAIAFLELLKLKQGKWDALALLNFFELSPIRQKFDFSNEDIKVLKKWATRVGIAWGMDKEQRLDWLNENYAFSFSNETKHSLSWQEGFDEFINLFFNLHKMNQGLRYSFQRNISLSEITIISKFSAVFHALKKDFQALDQANLTLNKWHLFFGSLFKAYLDPRFLEGDKKIKSEQTLKVLDELKNSSLTLTKQQFSLPEIMPHLEGLFQSITFCGKESKFIQKIQFASLEKASIVPYRIICLIGMDEGSFPRLKKSDSLDLLKNAPLRDYCPSLSDFDRYLFLEIVLSCRDHLMLSFVNVSERDSQICLASLIIFELLHYLDLAFTLNGEKVSKSIWIKHSSIPFHLDYFDKHSSYKTYSNHYLDLAKTYYLKKHSLPSFLENPISEVNKINEDIELDVKDLEDLFRNPLKLYFNKTLGIFLNENENAYEEPLNVSQLITAITKRKALQKSHSLCESPPLFKQSYPIGSLGDIAKLQLKNEIDKIQNNLSNLNVEDSDLVTLKLVDNSDYPEQVMPNLWLYPSIKWKVKTNKTIKLKGTITGISKKGILALGSVDLSRGFTLWPKLIVLLSLQSQYGEQFENQVLFIDKQKRKNLPILELDELWEDVVSYYTMAKTRPLLFSIDWISDFVKQDIASIEKKISQILSNKNYFYQSVYLKWMIKRNTDINFYDHLFFLSNHMKKWYKPLIDTWFSSPNYENKP